MDADRIMTRLNPLIVALLHSPLHVIASAGLMTLSFTGRRSGRSFTIPVGYQRSGDRITVLVSKAWRKQWWRNFEEPGEVGMRVRGGQLSGRARLVPAGAPEFREAFEATFARLPMLPRQFGIDDYRKTDGLTDADFEIVAEQGRMVAIELLG